MDKPLRMSRERSVLVLVDYQQRLLPAIANAERVLARAAMLAQVARELGVPVLATAQNPSKLGPNAEPVARLCDRVLEKMRFGAGQELLAEGVLPAGADVVIAGCETHVCLLQSALDLVEAGRRVWVVAVASGSRHGEDHEIALARLRAAGATVVSSEMVAFEWLETCEDERFRAVSALIKSA